MTSTARASRPLQLAGLVLVLAAVAFASGLLGQLFASGSDATSSVLARVVDRGPLGEADGAVPDGTTPFDADVPGVARLDPALARALRLASRAAARDGLQVVVDSGWRSPDYQRGLLRDAVKTYGSAAEAARWVAPPDRSAHVAGEAVDVGGTGVSAWIAGRGAAFGLCTVYANEPWHVELRPRARLDGCPEPYADPTQDPRLR